MAYGPDAAFKKPTKHDLCSFNVPNQPSLKEKLENALLSLVLNLFLWFANAEGSCELLILFHQKITIAINRAEFDFPSLELSNG